MREFETEVPLADRLAFEKAFRGVFGALEEMELIVRYSRYPNVTVHPIAVYRSLATAESEA